MTDVTFNPNPLMRLADADRHKGDCCARQRCRTCGSHVSDYNCNEPLLAARPEAEGWDWWAACDNADCENARGEGVFQGSPDWIEDTPI